MDFQYIAGFFDGEGSFVIRFKPDERYVTGIQVESHINITQKNLEILKLIQEELKMGKIYFHSRDQLWFLNIYKIGDKMKFVELMKDKLFVKKDKLEKFSVILEMLKNKQHLSKKGLKKLKMIWSAPETEANAP